MHKSKTLPFFQMKPESVNFHFTRVCNLSCLYCFHTALNTTRLDLDKAKYGLSLLREAGMKKINFSGGEPFVYAKQYLGPLIKYIKEELDIESVSVVSNGTLVSDEWLNEFAEHLDIFALSCDSFDLDTNKRIGRAELDYRDFANTLKAKLSKYNVRFKINTVVSKINYQEDMNEVISEINPFRWKCLQILPLSGENIGLGSLRNASPFLINNSQFSYFINRHKKHKCLVVESNKLMRDSYLILDEKMRFLNCTANAKIPGQSIIEVGVVDALINAGYNHDHFEERGGRYKW